MKTGSFWSWSLVLGLVALPLIGGCLRTVPPPSKTTAAAEPMVVETDPEITVPLPQDTNPVPAPPATNVEEAKVKPLPAEFVLPPNVQPGKPLTDLIRLAQAGADEGVLLAFVTNSPNTFNPRADDLIYLKDIGLPESVVSAMLQRDQNLKAAMAGHTNIPAPLIMVGTNAATPESYAAAPAYTVPPTPPAPAPAAPVEYVPESTPPPPTEVIYPEFYDSLAPYGSWVDVDGYGYCWQPAVVGVNPGWQPYFDGGYWTYTDCGWYWMSAYSWGWAPFHYGRWFHHNHWGWCWQPDRVWGPSWVCWRHNDAHCGWAPLPPRVYFTTTAGLTDPHRQVARLTPQHFRFVEWSHFRDQNLAQHGVGREQVNRFYSSTTLTTHIAATHGRVSNDGLAPERVSAATHTTVTRVTLRDVQSASVATRADRPQTSGRTLSVYRPQVAPVSVTQTTVSGRAPATKPLVTSGTSSRTTSSFTTHSTVSGASSGAPAPVTPPPATTSQRAINPTHGAAGLTAPWPARSAQPPATTRPETVQPPPVSQPPSSPAQSFRAGSRYYPTPGAPAANHWSDNSRARSQAPTAAAPEVSRFSAPVAEQPRRDPPENSRTRVQAPAPAAAERFSAPPAERPQREFAPAQRPSRVEAAESRASRPESRPSSAESHVSRPAPAAPSPAPAPARSSSSDRSDKPDRSDSGSRGGRR